MDERRRQGSKRRDEWWGCRERHHWLTNQELGPFQLASLLRFVVHPFYKFSALSSSSLQYIRLQSAIKASARHPDVQRASFYRLSALVSAATSLDSLKSEHLLFWSYPTDIDKHIYTTPQGFGSHLTYLSLLSVSYLSIFYASHRQP